MATNIDENKEELVDSEIIDDGSVLNERESERLRVARSIRDYRIKKHISQKDFAKSVGMLPAQLCNVEKGKNMPSLSTLCKIANELGVTVNDLLYVRNYRDVPVNLREKRKAAKERRKELKAMLQDPDLFGNGIERITFPVNRSKDALTPEVREDIRNSIAEYLKLEELCGIDHNPFVPLQLPLMLEENIGLDFLARYVRSTMGIGSTIVYDYVALLESCNLRVLFVDRELPENNENILESLSLYDTNNNNCFIVVNARLTPERQLFKLFYELGNIYLYMNNNKSPIYATAENCKWAKLFAASFLMPADEVIGQTIKLHIRPHEWTFDLVVSMKHHFGVSAETFLYRLLEVKRIDKSLADRIKSELEDYYKKNNNTEPGGSRVPLVKSTRIDLMKKLINR